MPMKQSNKLGNIQINEKEECATFSINPMIYPLEVIYSASYIMMDKAYIFLDGDPYQDIKVEIRKKTDATQNIHQLIYEFNNELLNYAVYNQQTEKNRGIREAILKKIILTNEPAAINDNNQKLPEEKDVFDPEGILDIWKDADKDGSDMKPGTHRDDKDLDELKDIWKEPEKETNSTKRPKHDKNRQK
jgi:His-Xaa-Ser system protein HxsD